MGNGANKQSKWTETSSETMILEMRQALTEWRHLMNMVHEQWSAITKVDSEDERSQGPQDSGWSIRMPICAKAFEDVCAIMKRIEVEPDRVSSCTATMKWFGGHVCS